MAKSHSPFEALLALWALLAVAVAPSRAVEAPGCPPVAQEIFFSPHPLLDSQTVSGFSDSLRLRLIVPLSELGYCVRAIEDYRSLLDTGKFGDNIILHALVSEGSSTTGPGTFTVTLLTGKEWAAGKMKDAVLRPLVSLSMRRDDLAGLVDVLVRKIAENMRLQYVAHVLIHSRPEAVSVGAENGLRGRTPVEWILPLGSLNVTLEKPGYIQLTRTLDLTTPGQHNYDFHLVRRRFYHSRLFYPAVGFAAAALAAFTLEQHYYGKYQGYGAVEARESPAVFGKTFRVAKTYERIGYGSLALAGACLAFTFRF
ncbi:MAG TPA: PEGA domain-containing protein [Fibrobacteria bacterium]|nr:PEGA domain-containing protein [Fibrobacteria bacterium]